MFGLISIAPMISPTAVTGNSSCTASDSQSRMADELVWRMMTELLRDLIDEISRLHRQPSPAGERAEINETNPSSELLTQMMPPAADPRQVRTGQSVIHNC